MSRHWREQFDPARHADHRTRQIGGASIEPPADRLVERWVYFVEVASFTFQFESLRHLRHCLEFFRQKLHPSSRLPDVSLEHYWQRWYERLPQWLFEEPKRLKVIAALERAAKDFDDAVSG
jgi:hypothetical protein